MKTRTTYLKLDNYFILAVLLIVSISTVSAQRSIRGLTQAEKEKLQIYPGFIVTASQNDTIFGEVQFFNPTYNEITVVFYKDGVRTQYYPADGDITEYAFRYKKFNKMTNTVEPHWFVYVHKLVPKSPIQGDAKEVFLEREIHGELTLYNYYTLETNKINSRRYKHNYYMEKQGTDGFALKTISRENYRQMIKRYLVLGNTQVDENLGTTGFGYKYLADIIQIQNAWITGSDQYHTLMLEKGQIATFSQTPKSKVNSEKDKMNIPAGNMDLEKDQEKIQASRRSVIPSGHQVNIEKETDIN